MQSSQLLYQKQKQSLVNLFQSYIQLAQTHNFLDVANRLIQGLQRFLDGKLFMVTSGEFKEGKSSFVNAILNEVKDDLFPVDADIATGIVTTICYGPSEKITVVIGDPGAEKQKEITREEIVEYAKEKYNKGNHKKVRMLVIESPNPQLKEGLVLIDTPGVGGLNTAHTGITYAYIPEADGILFVSDVMRPLSTEEIKFLKFIIERCPQVVDNIIFVATKKDANPNYTTILKDNRQRLSDVLKLSEEQIKIIPVSSHNKLSYLKTGDTEDLEDSNFPEIEDAIWKLLRQNGGYILLMRALEDLRTASEEIRLPIQAALSACQKEKGQEVEKLEAQLQSERQRLQQLQANNALWLTQLRDGMGDIRNEMQVRFRRGFFKIQGYADNYLNDEGLLREPSQIASLLERDLDTFMSNLGRELSQEASKLHQSIETESGLDLNFTRLETLNWEKQGFSASSIEIKQAGWWEKTLNTTRSASFNFTAGATIGGAVGGLVGGIIGTFFGGAGAGPGAILGAKIGSAIGGIAGGTSGVEQGLSQLKEKEIAQVRHKATPLIRNYLGESEVLCNSSLNEGITKMERAMRSELEGQILRLKATCERTLNSIEEARQLTDAQKAAKIKELALPLRDLEQLYRKVENLANLVIKTQETNNGSRMKGNNDPQCDTGEGWADG